MQQFSLTLFIALFCQSGHYAMNHSAIIILLTITLLINDVLPHLSRNLTDIKYDFIIVGGGSAGCILASRLSENANHSVLLLEAGALPDPGLDIPPTTSKYFHGNIKLYNSVPQNTLGLGDNRTIWYFVGKILGGTSQINGMIYNLGHPEDYNYWASVTGDPSWNYKNMSKYFEKVKKMIPISQPKYAPGLSEWIDGGKYLGYPSYSTYTSEPQHVSFAPFAFTKYRGRRASSYNYYIKPIYKERPNLHIITEAEVKRLLFNGTEAIGVIYELLEGGGSGGDNLQKAFATKEVILSAGVFGSPAILMKSGIGPKEEIDKYGVTPVKDLPVGQGLQDHLSVRLDFILNNQSAAFIEYRDLTPENLELFNKTGDGPYSSSFGMTAQAFIASAETVKTGRGDWPDLHLVSMHTPTLKGSKEWNEFRRSHLDKINHSEEVVVTAASVLTRAKSRGTFRLNETNINGDPITDYQFLSHPDDSEAVLEGMQILLKLYEETPAFKRIGARLAPIPHPSCNRTEFRSEAYWRCYIRYVSCTAFHAMGTCTMGKFRQDPNAVVDSHLRVIGVFNLMVVDASVIPVANSNPQAAVYALAEKAAEMILEKWGYSK